MLKLSSFSKVNQSTSEDAPYYTYKPRPGIVLDDTEYKPGRQPIITARPPIGQHGDIFDITVSAIQGPGNSSPGRGKPYIIPGKTKDEHCCTTSYFLSRET